MRRAPRRPTATRTPATSPRCPRRRGYHGSSIDEIAQAAEVSKALIYEHFPSKRDLHLSLLETNIQEIFERLAESAATSDPGEVRLRAGVDAFLEFVELRQ